jgi:hypothetical protein
VVDLEHVNLSDARPGEKVVAAVPFLPFMLAGYISLLWFSPPWFL